MFKIGLYLVRFGSCVHLTKSKPILTKYLSEADTTFSLILSHRRIERGMSEKREGEREREEEKGEKV